MSGNKIEQQENIKIQQLDEVIEEIVSEFYSLQDGIEV